MGFNPSAFDQSAFDPGAFKQGVPTPPYPAVSANRSIRLPAGGVWVVDPDAFAWCEIIWADVIPEGETLVSVAYGLLVALTLEDGRVEKALGKSAIKISGAAHASMHQIGAVATLSNGSTISFTAPLRCFNG